MTLHRSVDEETRVMEHAEKICANGKAKWRRADKDYYVLDHETLGGRFCIFQVPPDGLWELHDTRYGKTVSEAGCVSHYEDIPDAMETGVLLLTAILEKGEIAHVRYVRNYNEGFGRGPDDPEWDQRDYWEERGTEGLPDFRAWTLHDTFIITYMKLLGKYRLGFFNDMTTLIGEYLTLAAAKVDGNHLFKLRHKIADARLVPGAVFRSKLDDEGDGVLYVKDGPVCKAGLIYFLLCFEDGSSDWFMLDEMGVDWDSVREHDPDNDPDFESAHN